MNRIARLVPFLVLVGGACTASHVDPEVDPDARTEEPADGGTAEPTDGGVASSLGSCFEIFPGVEPREPPGSTTPVPEHEYHTNPTVLELGERPVGEPVTLEVGYYNFCGDPSPIVLGAGWLDESTLGGAFEILEVPEAVDELTRQSVVRLRFTPQEARTYDATFRMRFAHGYYDIVIHATGVL